MDPIGAASDTAFSGLLGQSMRMKVIAENIANADSTGKSAGAEPYRRKTIAFSNVYNSVKQTVEIKSDVGTDTSTSLRVEHIPGHPAADGNGDVKFPNVNMMVEMADMKQALRSYEANLQVVRQGREMASSLVDLLRSNG